VNAFEETVSTLKVSPGVIPGLCVCGVWLACDIMPTPKAESLTCGTR